MDLKTFPAESGKIFLADEYEPFAKLEGEDTPIDERAWVIVRQATQADNIRRNDLFLKRETKYSAGSDGMIDSISRVYNENPLRRQMEEVRLTLKEVGNLNVDSKPYFTKLPARDMTQAEFEKLWGGIPDPRIADAIHACVLKINQDWANPGE